MVRLLISFLFFRHRFDKTLKELTYFLLEFTIFNFCFACIYKHYQKIVPAQGIIYFLLFFSVSFPYLTFNSVPVYSFFKRTFWNADHYLYWCCAFRYRKPADPEREMIDRSAGFDQSFN